MKAGIELTLRIGEFGQQIEKVALPISRELLRELMEPMELSDDPLSLVLASPGMYGATGDAVTIRRKKFSFRRDTAREVARLVEMALLDIYGSKDVVNGYQREDWSEADQRQANYVRKGGGS